jgi:hypothetical protein
MSTATREEVYAAIDTEREYQMDVWPEGNLPNADNPLNIGECILLLDEYVSKARLAWTQEHKPETEALDIMRKCAGIAVNCMEQHGAPHRVTTLAVTLEHFDGSPAETVNLDISREVD